MENNKTKDVDTDITTDTVLDQPADNSEKINAEIMKLKRALDKANSEAAENKRKLQAKMTEDEQMKAASEEKENYLKTIEKELNITKTRAELMKSIEDEKIVDSVAEKLVEGNLIQAIKEIGKHYKAERDNLRKEIEQEFLMKNPSTPPQNQQSGVSKITDLTMEQWNELRVTDPALYKKFIGK